MQLEREAIMVVPSRRECRSASSHAKKAPMRAPRIPTMISPTMPKPPPRITKPARKPAINPTTIHHTNAANIFHLLFSTYLIDYTDANANCALYQLAYHFGSSLNDFADLHLLFIR